MGDNETKPRRFDVKLGRFTRRGPGERLAAKMDGETYMNFKVLNCPARGEMEVWVSCIAMSEDEAREMVLLWMADELAKEPAE